MSVEFRIFLFSLNNEKLINEVLNLKEFFRSLLHSYSYVSNHSVFFYF